MSKKIIRIGFGAAIVIMILIVFLLVAFKFIFGVTSRDIEEMRQSIVIEEVDDNNKPVEGTKTVHNIERDVESLKKNFISQYKRFECRNATMSKGEKACLQHLVKKYGVLFCNTRKTGIVNPETGHRLELDCYNPDLNIAIEYQGRMHYEYVPFFHKGGVEQFKRDQKRDQFKKRECKRLGILLVRVPYWIKNCDIPKFIDDKIQRKQQKI